jgi:EAL domain-containing protein (putative c-di-GMP-specific phosphodiesterase class I)
MIEPAVLSAVERFDIVKLADNGPLAFRLQRRPAGSPVTIEAIVPIEDVLGLGATDTNREIGGGRTHLVFANHLWIDVSATSLAEAGKLVAGPVAIDGSIAATAAPGGQQVVKAQSQSLPLAMVTSMPAIGDLGFDSRRIVVDLSVASILAALISIVFLRAPVDGFGPKRFLQPIRRNEIEIAYRPIVDLRSGKVAGAIVEMRWRRSGGVVLASSDFMPAVIRSGFEAQMLQFALQKCDSDLAEAFRLRPQLQLKIALDHDTLIQPGFVDRLQRMLDRKGLRASQLVLALTRIGEARAPEKSRDAIRQLQRIGVSLEIRQSSGDIDFGRGADEVSVTAVGVDSRVTLALETPDQTGAAEARFWIRNIVAASAATAIRVCAYRVRNYAALKQLKELGVDEVEGPVIATPLSPGSFMALVARAEFAQSEATNEPSDLPGRRKAASF